MEYNNPMMDKTGVPGAPPGTMVSVQAAMPGILGCPPGLEYLTQLDQLIVNQAVELLEAFTSIETQNRFEIKNSQGQLIFYAAEESGFCTRQFCRDRRGFTMHVADNFGNEVIKATREFKCCAMGCCWTACCDLCSWEIVVESPIGTPVGYVRQSCSVWKQCLEIQDADHTPILKLEGPWCVCECPCFDVEFKLLSLEDVEIGKVSKQWGGLIKQAFTEASNFGIVFPMDLDVKVKATLIGAVFLINMMLFERSQDRNN